MRALLVYPKFRDSYWAFEKALELINKRAMMPPLGLITVAAILPQDWEFRLRDRNRETVSDEDWAWADLVLLSAMLVQKDDMHAAIAEAHRHGKPTVCGGPYATALPQALEQAGADFLVLDEGEITIPLWLEHLDRGAKSGVYTASGEKPDVTQTPIPRFDLLDLTVVRKTRFAFRRYLWWMFRHNHGGVGSYLGLCAFIEHFLPYREMVKQQIGAQLAVYQKREHVLATEAAEAPAPRPKLAAGAA